MTLRFPEVSDCALKRSHLTSTQDPTQDERDALNSYFHLQARLYPCGECAAEFKELLKKYPPQVRFYSRYGISYSSLIPALYRLRLVVQLRYGYVTYITK